MRWSRLKYWLQCVHVLDIRRQCLVPTFLLLTHDSHSMRDS